MALASYIGRPCILEHIFKTKKWSMASHTYMYAESVESNTIILLVGVFSLGMITKHPSLSFPLIYKPFISCISPPPLSVCSLPYWRRRTRRRHELLRAMARPVPMARRPNTCEEKEKKISLHLQWLLHALLFKPNNESTKFRSKFHASFSYGYRIIICAKNPKFSFAWIIKTLNAFISSTLSMLLIFWNGCI